jgi:hypothetical protein
MSIYATAMQQGVSSLALMATGDNAQTKAAYNSAYQTATQRFNLANATHTAQLNISALKQDKILTDTQIKMSQDQAQALAKVSAAAAGVEGGSVDDVIYDTEKNEALALRRNEKNTEMNLEQQLASVYSGQSALLAVQDEEYDMLGELLQSFSNFELGDFKTAEAFANKPKEA